MINTKQHNVEVKGEVTAAYAEILSPPAIEFLEQLHLRFNARRLDLLEERNQKQAKIDQGELPHFLSETRDIRESDWVCLPEPADLLDRRVEITGPVDRKMVINALNSGAKVFMADFEDSNTPSWDNNMQGQINMRDAVDRTICFYNEAKDKHYTLNSSVATLMVRPRGWHMDDKYISCKGQRMSAGIVDFGLFFFHNAKTLISNGSGPYFYLPKMESHKEARLWNDIFVFAQEHLGIARGTIKATVLIETILASFELNEILYELREHSAGLNCGRWDYIFSYIKKLKNIEGYVLPDRDLVGMGVPFMEAYSKLVIQTCHKRGVHAMGGMAAQIPIKNDIEANNKALAKVKEDKLREVTNGHDGTWVAHPDLVPIAMEVFDTHMPSANQLSKLLDVDISASDLLTPSEGAITEQGFRKNINVGILYIESWLRGNGAAAIYHLMEDAATAEISRTQVWQWIHNRSKLKDGRTVTLDLYKEVLPSEIEKIKTYVGEQAYNHGKFEQAIALFERLISQDQLEEFLTTSAYELI